MEHTRIGTLKSGLTDLWNSQSSYRSCRVFRYDCKSRSAEKKMQPTAHTSAPHTLRGQELSEPHLINTLSQSSASSVSSTVSNQWYRRLFHATALLQALVAHFR